ncbi:MAG TPA: hypothetical protein VHC97_24640 [Thermoanaerobaculia bacterium]|jgi:hypothetical protein|nr:hypothetical protein [Thermoanaerobaculia bacterium]
MNNETRDERLRRLLREADPANPAVTDPGLTLDEVREMRRTVLTAVPERRRRFLPVFALAGAAAMALILLAVLLFRPAPEKAPAPKVAVVPHLPAPPRVSVQPPSPKEEEPKPREARKKTAVRRKHRAPKVHPAITEPEPAAVLAEAEPAEGPQQIQFSTPGGTRIIWVFSPGKASK